MNYTDVLNHMIAEGYEKDEGNLTEERISLHPSCQLR